MAFDAHSTVAPSGAVVPFPLPAPKYDPAKRGRLRAGAPLPENVVRLREPWIPEPIPRTPASAFIYAVAAEMKAKTFTAVTQRLAKDWCEHGDAAAYLALRMMTERPVRQ